MVNLQEQVAQAIAAAQLKAAQELRELALAHPETTVADFVHAMGDLGAVISVVEFLGAPVTKPRTTKAKAKARKKTGKKKATAQKAAPAKPNRGGRKAPAPRQNAEEKAAYQQAILTVLKSAGRAVSAKSLRAEVGGGPNLFLNTAKQLLAAGSIQAIGERAQRAYDLA